MEELLARYRLLAYGLAVLALIGTGFVAAWFWQANAYGKVIATNESAFQADMRKIASSAAEQVSKALTKQQEAEAIAAANDVKFTKEKSDALAENDRLRRAVADGSRRLRVAGVCSASDRDVPGATSAAGLGDAGTVELNPVAGRNVLDIRAGIIADQAALRAAQTYIRDVCR